MATKPEVTQAPVRLSREHSSVEAHYDVVVVGSGYGGSIAASRLARAGKKVALLERGKEFQPGEYPEDTLHALHEMQIKVSAGAVVKGASSCDLGDPTGLYDLTVGKDMSVFKGCGLGGTSLVNANVSIEADPRVFEDNVWPADIRAEFKDQNGLARKYYERARDMLKPSPLPDIENPLKLKALQAGAEGMGKGDRFYRPNINVNFKSGPNHVGVYQEACNSCGDCCSGCNYGSKNTLIMNYLPDAVNHGASIFTNMAVRYIKKQPDGKWNVYYKDLDSNRKLFNAVDEFVTADIVVVSGGSLGSTEVMLRSREKGLALSAELGRHFSGNGDILAFAYDTSDKVDCVGMGNIKPNEKGFRKIGPCITGIIDLRNSKNLEDGFVIEEGSPPGAISNVWLEIMQATAMFIEHKSDEERWKNFLARFVPQKALKHSLALLVMSQDDYKGVMTLQDDRLEIDWPGVGTLPNVEITDKALKLFSEKLGGTYVKNFIMDRDLGHKLVTVHPLGGCIMGTSHENSVTNSKGQVWDPQTGGVHKGLYVMDGAIVPRCLGVNPLFTISALSERCVAHLIHDYGWSISYEFEPVPLRVTNTTPGIVFTETMKGSAQFTNQGGQTGHVEFTFTISSDSVDEMVNSPKHQGVLKGTVIAPLISKDPLQVTEGRFNLFVVDEDVNRGRRMEYNTVMTTTTGEAYYFSGTKYVHSDEMGLDLWHDTTTLYIKLYEGPLPDAAKQIAEGALKILPEDFAKQLTTMRVTGVSSFKDKLKYLAKFGSYFAKSLWDVYGPVGTAHGRLGQGLAPRKKRALVTGDATPIVYELPLSSQADNKARIRLTRYQGGAKGPVILAHGVGTSSRIFAVDTVPVSLLEYLIHQKYDVWLLDYRHSVVFPVDPHQKSTILTVAMEDWPAAVKKVLEVTKAGKVDVVGQDVGAVSVLAGVAGGALAGKVRTVVALQVGLHARSSGGRYLLSLLHIPELVHKISPAEGSSASLLQQGTVDVLSALTGWNEHCASHACHNITGLYSLQYKHAHINKPTHDAIQEWYGNVNDAFFASVVEFVRHGSLDAPDGSPVASDPARNNFDGVTVSFVHGADNKVFYERGIQETLKWLIDTRHTMEGIPNYSHADCIIGKNAATEVFPIILKYLEAATTVIG